MKVLVVENDPVSQEILAGVLPKWGYEVVRAMDGVEGMEKIMLPSSPDLVLLDWMMPRMDGLGFIRKVRSEIKDNPPYIIMLTSRNEKNHIVTGLESGANDYITKPYDKDELRVRLGVGKRMIELQQALLKKISDLESAVKQINVLEGLIPICMYCKKIRDDSNYWNQIEGYIAAHSKATFTHGICPECYKKIVKESIDK